MRLIGIFYFFFSVIGIAVFLPAAFSPFHRSFSPDIPDSACFHPQYYLLKKALADTSLKEKYPQIRINMERWKFLPCFLGLDYLFVNIADFRLDMVKCDTVAMGMKVVVGRYYRKTPVFHAKLTHIIFNPSWNIPPNILKKDILPEILRDTSFLRNNHILVYQKESYGMGKQILTDTIDWGKINVKTFPFELVQQPGEKNALGLVKFVFPNKYNVYMHDTPFKELFEKAEPAYSSGCIRISDAAGLAVQLLRSEKDWDEKKIEDVIRSGKTVAVYLSRPMEVYIQYFTAWVDSGGKIQFRKDIYNRDVTGI